MSRSRRTEEAQHKAGGQATHDGLDLLCDFWISLSELRLAGVDPSQLDLQLIEADVVRPMIGSLLKEADIEVSEYATDWLRWRANTAVPDSEFLVTLDRGSYFNKSACLFDITRSVSSLQRSWSQVFAHRPREPHKSLIRQVEDLKEKLDEVGKSAVILADDGISTGGTLRGVARGCSDAGIAVDRVVVGCNNTGIRHIIGAPVTSLIPSHLGRPWLNERDLYWGLPRTGFSVELQQSGGHLYGVPFTATNYSVRERIGIDKDPESFRAACLRNNVTLWRYFESVAGRDLYFEDCPQLAYLPEQLGLKEVRVVGLLEELSTGAELRVN
jgi:hypothetical protein